MNGIHTPTGGKNGVSMLNRNHYPGTKVYLTSGDIVSVSAMNQRIIIINSYDTARAMINRKGSIYADRPVLTMGGELVGWRDILPFVRDPERLKQHRKHFHQLFGTAANLRQFLPMEEQESHRFLKQVLADPQNLRSHIKQSVLPFWDGPVVF
jgi:hypothetical protein